ncbi:MAG: ATP-binding protein [Candidatus Rhabdochlamydia sp.]
MKSKLGFRQKIILGHIFLFVAFIAFAFPFITKSVQRIAFHSLHVSTSYLADLLQKSQNQQQILKLLQDADDYIFFHVSLFNDQGEALYDSSLKQVITGKKEIINPLTPSEVIDALGHKIVYFIGYNKQEAEKLAYITLPFHVNNQTYILRTAIPFSQMHEFTREFEMWFLTFCFLAMLFFAAITWLIFHRINYPIQQIIRAIKPYQLGVETVINPIVLSDSIDEKDEFYQLAQTLNSLSEHLRLHIKQIIDERNEKEAILDSLGEGVIAVDAEMHIRYINFMASKMLGLSKKDVLGNVFTFIVEETPKAKLLNKCRQLLESCQKKRALLTDSMIVINGKKNYIDLIAAPKNHRSGAIVVLQDKTSHYKVLEMGKDFVANASHELRTPITIITGFAETLQDLPDLPRHVVMEITEKIVRNCQRMNSLVKNLLTLADLENLPPTRFKECDVVAIVETCRQVVLSLYENAKICIEKKEESILVAADPDILELAIINLLDNAAKYSPPPAEIVIQIIQLSEEVSITIQDKGIGIPAADLEHIFERFYTVDKAHSRRLGGAGLGLSIVKTIIENHHGVISVISDLGKGTTFTILLPKTKHITSV